MGLLRKTLFAAAAAGLLGSSPAGGLTLGFGCITMNAADHCAIGEAQLTVDVTEPVAGVIRFQFANAGPARSSITDVYFQNGPLRTLSLILNTAGSVEFSQFATPPELPGGRALRPPFVTARGFSADSDAPVQGMGVNPGESLGILFPLQSGKSFADVATSLEDGSLRIGIHVQGFAGGGSESFVNVAPHFPRVPEPPGLPALALLGLAVRMGLGRRLTSLRR
jgi:hypothetical protein